MDRQRIAEASKGVGKPKVGGPFELVDCEGNKFTHEDMNGGFSLVGPDLPMRLQCLSKPVAT